MKHAASSLPVGLIPLQVLGGKSPEPFQVITEKADVSAYDAGMRNLPSFDPQVDGL